MEEERRERDYSNPKRAICRDVCPLRPGGECALHQYITDESAKEREMIRGDIKAVDARIDKALRVNGWKLAGFGLGLAGSFLTLFGFVAGMNGRVGANGEILMRIDTRQQVVMQEVAGLRTDSVQLRERLGKVEIQLTEHRKAGE